MSGHNKWANIRIRKGAQDARRGKLFSKLIREITVALKEGGADLEHNAALKVAIAKARDANVPKDTIDKAVARASREGAGATFERVSYEGYGPQGIAVMVDVLTDNRNRVVPEIRKSFTQHGGSLGENGCVSWLFKRKGQFAISKAGLDEDAALELVIESGAEDFKEEDDAYYIYTEPSAFSSVRSFLEGREVQILSSMVTMIPNTVVKVTDQSTAEKLMRLLSALDESDDVQQVYSNWEMSDEMLEKVTS